MTSDPNASSIHKDPPAIHPKTTSRWRRLVVITLLAVTGLAAGTWTWLTMGGVSSSGPIAFTDHAKWQQFGKAQRYSADNAGTVDTYTDEVKAAFEKLKLDLKDLRSDVSKTEKQLRDADPQLDRALGDPLNTPLIGPEGARTVRDSVADRKRLAEQLCSDFQKHSNVNADVKSRLQQPLLDLINGVFCMGGEYENAYKTIKAEYDSGCRDPLVIYSMMLLENVGSDKRFQLFLEAYPAIETRATCSLLRFLVTAKINEFKSRWSAPEYIEYQERATEDLFSAVAEHAADGTATLFLRQHVEWIFGQMNGVARGDFIIRMVALSPDKFPMWLQHLIAYRFAANIASNYRGTRYISETSEENLRLFSEFSEIGGQHLIRAWTLKPDCNPIVNKLLSLESRAGGTPFSNQQWFRFAISLTCDDESTYMDLADFLLPKWGGSIGELAKYASLCSEVRFNDISIPFFASHFLWNQLQTQGQQPPLTNNLPMFKSVMEIFDYIRANPTNRLGSFAGGRAMLVLRVLWDWGRFAEIDWLLNNVESAFADLSHAHTYFVNYHLVQSLSRLAAKSHLPVWQTLHYDLLIHNDKLTLQKVERCRLAIGELRESTGEEATWALNHCEQICNWWTTYNSGSAVTLAVSEQYYGWNWFSGGAKYIDEGFELTTTIADSFSVISPALRFPLPHAIEADVELLSGESDIYGYALFAGPVGYGTDTQGFTGGLLRFCPGIKLAIMDSLPGNQFDEDDPYFTSYSIDITKARLRLEVREDGLSGFVESDPMEKVSREISSLGFVHFGRYCNGLANQQALPVSYRVTNLKVIPLATEEESTDQVDSQLK